VLSWEVIYALSDAQVQTLLGAARDAGATVIAGTTQLLGPARHVLRSVKDRLRRPSGWHGWQLSVAVYRGMAADAGMSLRVVWPPLRRAPEDNFVYLVFSPAPDSLKTRRPRSSR
jgi:hypothetical protein